MTSILSVPSPRGAGAGALGREASTSEGLDHEGSDNLLWVWLEPDTTQNDFVKFVKRSTTSRPHIVCARLIVCLMPLISEESNRPTGLRHRSRLPARYAMSH